MKIKENTKSQGGSSMDTLQPQRSAKPPAFGLTTSDPETLLKGSIGRDGDNQAADLLKLAQVLRKMGAPPRFIQLVVDSATSGTVIERYQKEVLHFKTPDGRIDPGGTTLKAILNQEGRKTVEGWMTPKKREASAGKSAESTTGEIPMVLNTSQYFSQYNQGAPCVPLSVLKANLSSKSTEKGYRNVGCYQTCRYMLKQAGFTPGSRADSEYLLKMDTKGARQSFSKSIGGLTENFASSLKDLDESLLAGKPVIVGVNKNTKNHKWVNTQPDGKVSPTDHFVVIVGKTITADGKAAYRYFDPARYSASKGTSASNLLIQEKGGQFTGNPYKNHNYSLSEIRATP